MFGGAAGILAASRRATGEPSLADGVLVRASGEGAA
jgi:hypothetical protein